MVSCDCCVDLSQGAILTFLPNLGILVEDIFVLLVAMTVKRVRKITCGRNKNISNYQVKVSAKYINAKIIVCELLVNRVVTFGVIMYRNQRQVNFILHFAELHFGRSIRCKHILLEIIFSNVIKLKEF